MKYKVGDIVQLVMPSKIKNGHTMVYGIPASIWYKYEGVKLRICRMIGGPRIYLAEESTGLAASLYHWLPEHLTYYKSKVIRKVAHWK